MSGLRQPGLGPIVGHTTATSCRLWIRAGDPGDQDHELDENRRTIGVVAVLEKNGLPVEAEPAYFRLHREFDRTGTFQPGVDVTLGSNNAPVPLEPETEYVVGLGTITIDDPNGNDENVTDAEVLQRLPPLGQWMVEELRAMPTEAKARFRTLPAARMDQLTFMLGSCRYPGLLWKTKQADRIFGPPANQLYDPTYGPPARFVLMVGDQIYADEFNRSIPIGRADTAGEFQERYLTAFSSPNMRRLLRTVPHYMILDDHEIEDNWTQDRLRSNSRLFNFAIGAYMSYQWSHGPRNFGRILYYSFDACGYPFFVLDTRTQRYKDDVADDLTDNHLIGRPSLHPNEPSQMSRLLTWLETQQQQRGNVPKCIVTSSVFVPNDISERWGTETPLDDINHPRRLRRMQGSDSWPAYPQTRKALLDHIVQKRIQNVVFLCGDIHCSNLAQMRFTRNRRQLNLRAFSVTSSAFYWPFPFADDDPANYVHDSTAPGQEDTFQLSDGVTMDYQAWNFTQEDNYCRVTIDRTTSSLRVTMFDASGEPIRTESGAVLEDTFALAPWR